LLDVGWLGWIWLVGLLVFGVIAWLALVGCVAGYCVVALFGLLVWLFGCGVVGVFGVTAWFVLVCLCVIGWLLGVLFFGV